MTPKDDHIASSNQTPVEKPHKPAKTTVHLGPGFRMKDGKVERIPGYGLNTSAKIKQRKSKKITVKRKQPT